MNIKEIIEYGKNNLIEEDSYIISKVLLKYLLNVDDGYIIANSQEMVESKIEETFKNYVSQLNDGMPIQYITNNQEFMKLNFYVDSNVLIPQPDTEILVYEIIEKFKNMQELKMLDLCTGSGAIGISIAKYIPNVRVTMTDISEKALKISNKNSVLNNVENKCKFILSDMFENINEKFDIIVSNPPYIETEVISTLSKQVQKEPIIALDGGIDGLDFYRKIAKEAKLYLKTNGTLAMEIGYNQKDKVIKILEKEGYINIYSKKDLSGNDRIIVCNNK